MAGTSMPLAGKARPEGPAMTRKWPVPAMLAPTGTSRAMTQDKPGHDNEQAASGPRPPPLQQVDVEYPAVAPLLLRNQFGNPPADISKRAGDQHLVLGAEIGAPVDVQVIRIDPLERGIRIQHHHRTGMAVATARLHPPRCGDQHVLADFVQRHLMAG